MVRLKVELVSREKVKFVTIYTAALADLVAAVERKFQIRCRSLSVDRVELEDDDDVAELQEGDLVHVYEQEAAGPAGVTGGEQEITFVLTQSSSVFF